jgi:Ca-activated chloride channel homolog
MSLQEMKLKLAGVSAGMRRGAITECALLLVLACCCGSAASQTAPPSTTGQQPGDAASQDSKAADALSSKNRIKVRVQVVNVPVTVLDKRRLPVIDVTQDEFQVYEDGKLQKIKYFSQETHQPLRIGLIVDTSNSARRQIQFEQDAASEFVFRMLAGRNTKNQIFLQTFDATSSIVHDFTSDPESINEKIRELRAGGGKALYDAIYSACRDKLLYAGDPESTRRILVVVSDGLDVHSQHSLDEAISMARKAEVMVYTISNVAYGYTSAGSEVLQAISDGTGGGAFFPLEEAPGSDLETGYLSHGQIGETSQNKGLGAGTGAFSAQRLIRIAESMESISLELGAQYQIGYTPSNDALDGSYRGIRVVVVRKGVSLRWKPGYFAASE